MQKYRKRKLYECTWLCTCNYVIINVLLYFQSLNADTWNVTICWNCCNTHNVERYWNWMSPGHIRKEIKVSSEDVSPVAEQKCIQNVRTVSGHRNSYSGHRRLSMRNPGTSTRSWNESCQLSERTVHNVVHEDIRNNLMLVPHMQEERLFRAKTLLNKLKPGMYFFSWKIISARIKKWTRKIQVWFICGSFQCPPPCYAHRVLHRTKHAGHLTRQT